MKKSVNSLYESRKFIRIILMLLSLVISITTLYLSQLLVVKIAGEEKKKMEMWAEAESILSDPFSEGDLGFQLRVVQSNTTIPAILVDEKGTIRQSINIRQCPCHKPLTHYLSGKRQNDKPVCRRQFDIHLQAKK